MAPPFEVQVRSVRHLQSARHAVRDEMSERGIDEHDAWTVELVVGELLGAAFDAEVATPVVVKIESYARLYGIRLSGIPKVDLHDAPFHLREQVLHRLTLAFGERRNADGTIDLWAEVPRTIAGR